MIYLCHFYNLKETNDYLFKDYLIFLTISEKHPLLFQVHECQHPEMNSIYQIVDFKL